MMSFLLISVSLPLDERAWSFTLRGTRDERRVIRQITTERRLRSPSGLGRVKTPKSNLRIEISSRLRQFETITTQATTVGRRQLENNSAHSSPAHVFTQPRSVPNGF